MMKTKILFGKWRAYRSLRLEEPGRTLFSVMVWQEIANPEKFRVRAVRKGGAIVNFYADRSQLKSLLRWQVADFLRINPEVLEVLL